MCILRVILASTLLCGCAVPEARTEYSANENLLVTGFPDLPQDAKDVAERLASCRHFSGEINGDQSARDEEVQATMSKLRCGTIEEDVLEIRRKYASDSSVQSALTAASNL
jgi:hypothetical protein